MVSVQAKGNTLEASIVGAYCGVLANLSNTEVHHVSASVAAIAVFCNCSFCNFKEQSCGHSCIAMM